MLAGNRGNSSTAIICNSASVRCASSIAAASAFAASGEPSLATSIRLYTLISFCGDSRFDMSRLGCREWLELRLEPALCYQGRHHSAANYRRQQDCVLTLVNNVIGQTKKR